MMNKIKSFLSAVKLKTVEITQKTKNVLINFFDYIKNLDLKILITLGVMLILIIGLLITVIIYSVKSIPASTENDVVEFSTNYDGNLINIYSDEYALFPYGNLAFSNDGANKKGLELKGGYLEMTKPFDLGKEFTFQTWVKITDTSVVNPIIFGRASSGGDVHNGPVTLKFFNEYQTILCDITFIDAKGEYISRSFASDDFINTDTLVNIWHHIAVTFDENGYTLYFDGNAVNNIPLDAELADFKEIASNKNPFFIGIGENGNMNAKVDETRIFTYSISAEEIKKEYETAHPVKTHRIVMKNDSDSADVNGQAKTLEGKILKDLQNESYLVPLKSVIEYIGGSYTNDENELDKFDISFKNKTISMWLMDTNAVTDGNHTKLDFYPQEFDDVVYVPVIMFSKLFALDVSATDESIIINY